MNRTELNLKSYVTYANKGIENFFGILYLILLLYRDHSTLNPAGATVLIVCHHISTSALETQLLNSHPHNNVALWDFKFLIRLLVSNYFFGVENSLKKCCFSLVKLFKWTDLRKVKPFQKVFRLLSHFIYFFLQNSSKALKIRFMKWNADGQSVPTAKAQTP